MAEVSFEDIKKLAKRQLEDEGTKGYSIEQWLKPTKGEIEGEKVRVFVETDSRKNLVSNGVGGALLEAAKELLGEKAEIVFVVSEEIEKKINHGKTEIATLNRKESLVPIASVFSGFSPSQQLDFRGFKRRLDERFTFGRFIMGPKNEQALRLVKTFKKSGSKFLCIMSGIGLGKTHLIQALCHEAENENESVCYFDGSELISAFVAASKKGTVDLFEKELLSCHLLAIDGIHCLGGKKGTQTFLLNIMKRRTNNGDNKKTVCTSLENLIGEKDFFPELNSVISSGIIVKLDPPCIQTTSNIIAFLLEREEITATTEVVHRLNHCPVREIGQLVGIIENIKARMMSGERFISKELLEEVLKLYSFPSEQITLQGILKLVCDSFETSEEMIKSKARKKKIAFPRQVFCYLARKCTAETIENIGKFILKSHSTVLYSVDIIESLMKKGGRTARQVEFLLNKLKPVNNGS